MGAEANGDSQRSREVLLAALAGEEAEFCRLEGATTEARGRIASLQTQLAALGPEPLVRVCLPVWPPTQTPQTAEEKVRLFRELFRGRVDVFPTRFVSQKTGKAGYAPACTNKFVRGVCELPRIKCSDCTNQAFRAVTDKVIRNHPRGEHVMGVYPLLEDDTCWFLAVDFGMGAWRGGWGRT